VATQEAATEAAESTAVAQGRAVVSHAPAKVATAAVATAEAATDRLQVGLGSAEHHQGFGLPAGRSDCSNHSEAQRQPHWPKADGAAGWAG
jgi:hypothetical protein